MRSRGDNGPDRVEADSGGSYIRYPRIRRSSTQGNRLREPKDQLHEAI